MGIGAVISIAASIFQAVRAYNNESAGAKKADQVFAELDADGKGSIGPDQLQSAFDKIALKATQKADQLFTKLDVDGDGQITKSEFSSSIGKLADQLDEHYQRLRMQTSQAGFTKDELAGAASNLTSNFDKADANSDGKISVKEAVAFGKAQLAGGGKDEGENIQLMLQVMKLMQAYGNPANATDTAANKAAKISASA